MIKLEHDIVSDFEAATSREWLETNGIGGYSSGTISGAGSRRYHGMLVAATKPPIGRMVLLSKFEETLVIDGERFDLSSNRFPGALHPDGYKYLTSFRVDPFPVWTYTVGGIEIEKRLFMVHGENTTVARWTVINGGDSERPPELELRPLLAFRDHHHLRRADDEFDGNFGLAENRVTFMPLPNGPQLHLGHNDASVEAAGNWYRNFEYAIEAERGFDFVEDLYQPCVLKFDLARDAVVTASVADRSGAVAEDLEQAEIARRAALTEQAGVTDDLSGQLVLAADQFIVKRGTGHTMIAGYHWFSDWGRDTMIALPGLTLATGRPEIARSILAEFGDHISEGMLPNRFPDKGEEPEYNTVDATLWFFEAIRAYAEKTADYDFVRNTLYLRLVDIIDWHVRGTRYGIHVDTDGLLSAGEQGVQLTWMDAKIGDWVVTPRIGKPVEIQALWYNALCILEDLARRFDDEERQITYRAMSAAAKGSFRGQFWNDSAQCLYDVVNGENKDASMRPNQIFAVSLRHTMLDAAISRKIVDKVESELLTPFGLRSLSPADPAYVPIYIGSPLQRDGSYHQGTVWGWLIGPFVDAYRRTYPRTAKTESHICELLSGIEAHLSEAMLGQISEIFDAATPNAPRGCAAQAWSVAEVLRVLNAR